MKDVEAGVSVTRALKAVEVGEYSQRVKPSDKANDQEAQQHLCEKLRAVEQGEYRTQRLSV
jgi:hypothetical protein